MERTKDFEARFARILEATSAKNESELARILGIHPSSVGAAKKRQQIPTGWIEKVSSDFSVSSDWLFFGKNPKDWNEKAQITPASDVALIMIPMVEARLSAGHGSLQVSGNNERSYAFRSDFLHRRGNPKDMVLMRVEGDSMQPEIMDGDVVLLDQSKKGIRIGRIFAVGFEEAIYLKRIDMLPGKVILKSVNPDYPPVEIEIHDQAEDMFRIIGQVIWCGREYS